jgi:hypothetical protein
LQNGNYVGSVSHFTYWNCDAPGNRAKLRGKARDCDGDVVSNMTMKTGQTTAWIDQDGNWERWVPAGVGFKLSAYDMVNNTDLNLNIAVPALANDQEHDMGTITVPCRQKVKSNVVDCNNSPFSGYAIIEVGAKTFRGTITNGKLSVTVYSNGELAELYIYNASAGQLQKNTITLPVAGKSIDLGLIQACPSKTVVTEFSFDYDDGTGVQSINLTNFSNGEATYIMHKKIMIFSFETAQQEYATFNLSNPKIGPCGPAYDGMHIFTQGKRFIGSQNMNFIISKYENPGDEVSGTFSGSMILTSEEKIVTITNGKFRALRLPDEL